MKTVELTEINFHHFVSNRQFVIVDIYTVACPPCKFFATLFEEVAGMYENKICFSKLDAGMFLSIAMELRVTPVPKLIFYVKGRLISINNVPAGIKAFKDLIEINFSDPGVKH